ncbi:hypothetical protein IT418_01195 [bacterium]|nr:hypothetical protein [bacterium]
MNNVKSNKLRAVEILMSLEQTKTLHDMYAVTQNKEGTAWTIEMNNMNLDEDGNFTLHSISLDEDYQMTFSLKYKNTLFKLAQDNSGNFHYETTATDTPIGAHKAEVDKFLTGKAINKNHLYDFILGYETGEDGADTDLYELKPEKLFLAENS